MLAMPGVAEMPVGVQFEKEAIQTRPSVTPLSQGRLRKSRGSPRSFDVQRTLAQDDKQTAPLPKCPKYCIRRGWKRSVNCGGEAVVGQFERNRAKRALRSLRSLRAGSGNRADRPDSLDLALQRAKEACLRTVAIAA